MLEEDINKKIRNRLNQENYPDTITVSIISGNIMECSLNGGEGFLFDPVTKTIEVRANYFYQGNIKGEQICKEFIDAESLYQLYLQITNPKKEVKEYDGIRLDPTKKRITSKDKIQITKYVAAIEEQNKSIK